ncbi:MAG: hypothetical protein N3A72_06510 [bacterium]|nr:hypothetical protein [bacterium]
MFRRILLGFFWDSYDNLGHLILANLLWFFCNILGLFLGYIILHISPRFSIFWILFSIPLAIFSVTTTAMFYYTKLMVEAKDSPIKQFFLGMKLYFWKGIFITLIHIFIGILVMINIQFYIQIQGFGMILAGLAFWCGILVAMQSLYAYSILVQHNLPLRKTFKRSFLLLLDNLWITVGIFLFSIIFFIVSLLSGIGPILFMMSCIAMLGNNAIYEIMTKYEKKPEPEPALAPGEKPTSWKQILDKEKADQQPKWRHDNRGWKDIFRPWDYQ